MSNHIEVHSNSQSPAEWFAATGPGVESVFQYGLCAIASRPAQNIHGSLFGVVHEKARQGCPKSRESVRGQTQIIKSAHVSTVCQPTKNKSRDMTSQRWSHIEVYLLVDVIKPTRGDYAQS